MRLVTIATPGAPTSTDLTHSGSYTASSGVRGARKDYELKRVLSTVLLLLAAAVPTRAQGPGAVGPRTVPPQTVSPLLRGVPSGTVSSEPITLTLVDVLGRALEHNLGLINAETTASRVEGDRRIALSELLPNITGRVNENRQQINLAAFGFPLPAGVPSLVGPFNVFDARLSASQSVFDLRAMNALRAETHNRAAASHVVNSTKDGITLAVGTLFLQTLAASARVDSAEAQLQTAQALFEQTQHLKEAGIVAGIDVLRAEVQLGNERQQATAARNDFAKAKLQLGRAIGLPPGQPITLSSELPGIPETNAPLEQAIELALRRTPSYLAAQERVQAAEANRRAAVLERMPSVRVNADYGRLGRTVPDTETTYSVSGTVNVPIINGGRTAGRIVQAEADLRARQAELADVKAGIDFDVRAIYLDVVTNDEELRVATRSRELASQQLVQARDRLTAGVASNIEVVQAQQAVATANEGYTAALYNLFISKALLASAVGLLDDLTRQGFGGVR